jgi:hypothetical protein
VGLASSANIFPVFLGVSAKEWSEQGKAEWEIEYIPEDIIWIFNSYFCTGMGIFCLMNTVTDFQRNTCSSDLLHNNVNIFNPSELYT